VSTVLLDVDGIICDFAQVYINILNRQTGRRHTVEDVTHWDFYECVATQAEDAAVWRHISSTPRTVSGAGSYIMNLNAYYMLTWRGVRVVAVTTPRWHCPLWMPERFTWLADRGFSTKDIVFTSDKSLIGGDMLIDDNFENVSQWQAKHPYGRGILLTRPWNAAFEWADRIESLADVL
jgi:5'(3')-deoxyribonucleotidase